MARLPTRSIHAHGYYDRETGSFIPPVYLSVVYEHPDVESGKPRIVDRGTELKYSREENPTVRALERVIASLELAEDALAFNSGMAAISTLVISLVRRGGEVVVPIEAYGKTVKLVEDLAAKFDLRVKKAWPSAESIAENMSRSTSLVIVETITNPTLKVVDLEYLGKVAGELGVPLIVDNTFATPVLVNPLEYGASYVVHSATKYLAGHNDVVGGAVATSRERALELWQWRTELGTIMQPMEAYLTLRGLKTLEVRFERQSRTAQAIAEYLSDHPRVSEVYYPGLPSSPYKSLADRLFKRRLYGGVVSFKVRGGGEEALKLLRRLRLIKPSPSLGGTESLITVPAVTAASSLSPADRAALGIDEGLLRLSVGLEDQEDLIEDISQALS